MNPLCCLQIKLYSMDRSGPEMSPPPPKCTCMSLNALWRKMRRTGGREGIWGMKCCVLNPVLAQSTHLMQNPGMLKHSSHERGKQSSFYVQRFCPVLSSQLSHSGSEFDQYVKPDTDKAPCNEHERLSKHPGTGTHTHLLTRTYAFIHTHFFFYVSVSHILSFLCFGHKRHKITKTNNSHTVAPRRSALLICSQNPIHLNNEEEESASARLSVASLTTCIFEGANQSVYLTKFMTVPWRWGVGRKVMFE